MAFNKRTKNLKASN